MASLHQVVSAKDGESFMSIGPLTIHKQIPPKVAKNKKLFSSIILKSAGNEVFMTVWGDSAKWKVPLGEFTLRGKFTKAEYPKGSACLQCDELVPPEGSVEFDKSEVINDRITIKDCLDAGLRAADYIIRKDRPEFASEAFSFASNALLNGAQID
jgi:hypothetical protein